MLEAAVAGTEEHFKKPGAIAWSMGYTQKGRSFAYAIRTDLVPSIRCDGTLAIPSSSVAKGRLWPGPLAQKVQWRAVAFTL